MESYSKNYKVFIVNNNYKVTIQLIIEIHFEDTCNNKKSLGLPGKNID